MDAITELRPQYKDEWLAEYTPYRLGSALGRWDAEYQYWRGLQDRLKEFYSALDIFESKQCGRAPAQRVVASKVGPPQAVRSEDDTKVNGYNRL